MTRGQSDGAVRADQSRRGDGRVYLVLRGEGAEAWMSSSSYTVDLEGSA